MTYGSIKNILLKQLNKLISDCEEDYINIDKISLHNFNSFVNYLEYDSIIPQIGLYNTDEIGINWRNNDTIFTIVFAKNNKIIWSYIKGNYENCGCYEYDYFTNLKIVYKLNEIRPYL